MNNEKENLKLKIQKIFTKLRSDLNNREDELLLEIDKKYESFISDDIIKNGEKLPNKIKKSLEKGKLLKDLWGKNKLHSLINDCLNIENNINEIKKINNNIKSCNSRKFEINCLDNESEINDISEAIKNFGSINDIRRDIFFDSEIEFNKELVKTWLNHRDFKTELLFRKTRDGSTPTDFHNKYDNKGNTIVLIETEKGNKFGGYTESPWDTSGEYKVDQSTFIFSFNNNQKYMAKNKEGIICGNSKYGPWFGNNFPEIVFNNTLNKGHSWNEPRQNKFIEGRKIANGEEYWEVKELEVFKIIYL